MSWFITFEGPDGAGKSTQIGAAAEYLRHNNFNVLQTREPGGTPIGQQIRQLVLDATQTEMITATEVLLYSASRAQLVQQTIIPHLDNGGVVLCDRYIDSFYAYQGYGRQVDLATLRVITEFATQQLKPDLTILLDIDVESGLQRRVSANKAGAGDWNRLDQLTLAFHQRVRDGYHMMVSEDPERWLTVDAAQPIETVSAQIREALKQRLRL